ncbi:hypothetical protein [Streptomyces sp. NPDC001450]
MDIDHVHPESDPAEALRAEFGRLVLCDPGGAMEFARRLVKELHAAALAATGRAREAGVGFAEIGKALALVEESGDVLLKAAEILLGRSGAALV